MRKIVRDRILKKYGSKCADCGSCEKLEVDHIIPLSRGGRHDENNFQILCRTCNRKKAGGIDFKKYFIIGESYDYVWMSRKFPITSFSGIEFHNITRAIFAENDEILSK